MRFTHARAIGSFVALTLTLFALVEGLTAFDDDHGSHFRPGNLVVSRSVYVDAANLVVGVTAIPPNCLNTQAPPTDCFVAGYDGTYPTVFNNNLIDGSFGITSKIFLDQLTTSGGLINSLEVPNSSQHGVTSRDDQMVTSFSSKSELALNLSSDRRYLTFMGYLAPIGAIDVSNSNTPGEVDPTNPVGENVYRAAATVDSEGHFSFTETNAYSGNNGRAAILSIDTNHERGHNFFYTSGNAGNGTGPNNQPPAVVLGAGTQIFSPADRPEHSQNPGTPVPVGSFSIEQLGLAHDKIGKDDNFRGLALFNNVLYFTKGSGSNGVNTVYFIDTSPSPGACPSTTASGVPVPGSALPTMGVPYFFSPPDMTDILSSNMCILNGFTTVLARDPSNTSFPFGVWFANARTLYVADEGNGTNTYDPVQGIYTAAAAQTTAGLQKWVFDDAQQIWTLAYTLYNGLDLGVPYTVAGYPAGNNAATGRPWSPGTDGIRNITGRVNGDGTVTIWGITSTVSGNGDQGADPNKLVTITDRLSAHSPGSERFRTLRTARLGEVLRGVSFTPGTPSTSCDDHGDDDRCGGGDDGHGEGHGR